MTEAETTRKWVQTRKEFGPELEKTRQREVRDDVSTLPLKLQQLGRAYNHATSTCPPDQTPGMVEMQHFFAKLRR